MSAIPRAVVDLVHERAQGLCERCGTYARLELHHRVYRSRGGAHTAGNLVAVCGWGNHTGCHGWAHDGLDAERAGFSLRSWVSTPSLVPVKMRAPGGMYRWFLLDDNGNKTYLPTDDAFERMVELGIPRRLIAEYSNPGDLVYDPFGGIGSTALTAVQAGRRAYSSELNPASVVDSLVYLRRHDARAAVPTLFDMLEDGAA